MISIEQNTFLEGGQKRKKRKEKKKERTLPGSTILITWNHKLTLVFTKLGTPGKLKMFR